LIAVSSVQQAMRLEERLVKDAGWVSAISAY
jgi:hypothetical protein